LQDCGYSAGGKNNGWSQGQLHRLGIILKADSALAAIQLSNYDIRIYYQGWFEQLLHDIPLIYDLNVVPGSGFIQALSHNAPIDGSWVDKGLIITTAVRGSSLAATACSHSNRNAAHVYYQDLDLHIREQIWSPTARRWVSGEHIPIHSMPFLYGVIYTTLTGIFDGGAQPHGTPISVTTTDDDTDIHVSWKDEKGRIVSNKQSKSLGCGTSAEDYRGGHLDGRG
jgi:hypothetical protein